MKRIIIMGIILLMGIISAFGQNPLGFNYQSVLRDAEGVAITNQDVDMRISIIQSTMGGTAIYSESHDATTNAFGLVNIVIGQGTTIVGNFTTIDWGADNYFLKLEIDIDNSGIYIEIGTTQLLSVPYANYAFSGNAGRSAYEVWISLGNEGTEEDFIESLKGPIGDSGPSAYEVWISLGNEGTEEDFINSLTGSPGNTSWADGSETVTTNKKVGVGTDNPTSSLQIVAPENQKAGDPIFEIKNTSGKTVFAVYQNEVKVFIDDTTTAQGFTVNSRNISDETEEIMAVGSQQTTIYVDQNVGKESFGGFAISGRTTTKLVENLFTITPDLTQFYIKEPTDKESFGGFAISGRTTTKEDIDILSITPSLTEFYVEEPNKATFGGFAISGRTTTKTEGSNLLNITPAITKFTIEEPAKESFGGFAISGRTTTKEEINLLSITPSLTEFYVEEPSKATFGGFAISGRTTTKTEGSNLLNITPALTKFTIEQPAKAAFGGFAISGRTTTKDEEVDVLNITPDYTRFYIDEPNEKAAFGGFAISGRTTTKSINDEIFKVTPGLTEVFIDGESGKAAFGGFAISGRTTTKESGLFNIFTVQPNKTEVYIKNPSNKSLPEGFSISGLNENFEPTNLFTVSDSGTYINTPLSIAPKVITGDTMNVTSSFTLIKSSILNNNDLEVTKVGLIYSTENTLNPIENTEDPTREDVKWNNFEYPNDFSIELENLASGTQYYYKAFAISEDGLVGYGEMKSFTTVNAFEVTFNVIDQSTEVSIDNAEISMTHADAGYVITNTPGDNVFFVAKGTYDHNVHAPGYSTSGNYYLTIESDTTITVYMSTSEYGRITFHVTDNNNNNIENADIEFCYAPEFCGIWLAPTNVNGITYSMNSDPISFYSATANGYDTVSENITTPTTDTIIEIVLPILPSRQITFNVTYQPDSEIIPAVGATVTIYNTMKGIENYTKTLITGIDGKVIFDDVPDAYLEYFIYILNEYEGSGQIEEGGDKTINELMQLSGF